MKLLLCPHCLDFVNLRVGRERSCECGKCCGHYIMSDPTRTKAVVTGPNVQVIGIDNLTFIPVLQRALKARPDDPPDDEKDYWLKANEFQAWVFGPNALQVTKATTEHNPDLWWQVSGENVTCANCHMPVYRPQAHHLCPSCVNGSRDDSLTQQWAT